MKWEASFMGVWYLDSELKSAAYRYDYQDPRSLIYSTAEEQSDFKLSPLLLCNSMMFDQ